MALSGPGIGGLSWARGLGPFGRWGPPGWPRMWGEGEIGPTLVLYLRKAGATATEAWRAVAASAEPTVGLPWLVAMVVVGASIVATTVVAVEGGPGLEPPTRGGEDCLILG